MFDWVRHLFFPSYNLGKTERKTTVWGWAIVGLALVLLVTWGVRNYAVQKITDPMNPLFDVTNTARMNLFKFFVAWGKSVFVLAWSYVEWSWIDNLLGHRLFTFADTDPDPVRQGKKTNAAIVLIGLVIMNAILFAVV